MSNCTLIYIYPEDNNDVIIEIKHCSQNEYLLFLNIKK